MDPYFSTGLQHFLSIAQEGKITSAARKMGITQSALSMSIRKFEDMLGITLFDRVKRGLILTNQGSQLFSILQRNRQNVLNELRDILDLKKMAAIKIGCTGHEGQSLLKCLDTLGASCPPYHLYLLRSYPLYQSVVSGILDFGFVTWSNKPEGHLISRKIRHNKMAIVGLKKNYPNLHKAKSLAELADVPWVSMPKIQNTFTEEQPLYRNSFICDGTEQLKDMVLSGRGICHAQLKWFTTAELKRLNQCHVIPEDEEAALYGICSKRISPERRDWFEALCQKLVKEK